MSTLNDGSSPMHEKLVRKTRARKEFHSLDTKNLKTNKAP